MGGLERHAGQTVTRQTVTLQTMTRQTMTRQTMTRQTMTRRTITGRHVLTRWRAIPALMAVTSLVIVGAAHASQATPVKDTVKNTDQLSAISTGPHAKVTVRVKGAARIVTKVVPMPAGSLVSSSGPALATMIFGGTSACDLQAIGSANGQAASRTPPGALLQLTRGQILCTVVSVAEQIHLCGNGVIFVDGESQSAIQFNATCDRDPRFSRRRAARLARGPGPRVARPAEYRRARDCRATPGTASPSSSRLRSAPASWRSQGGIEGAPLHAAENYRPRWLQPPPP